ncbi:hypothetical protein D9615_003783 [Tricholomella constricta]|uniref:3'-5' exonuclease n=1 Tax=Tricholomella constricta TaxID=117010 RepID=A0A8H5HI18_9AGAR|nr:hypothetical protein D9615_003783 [Tricholomella constricta]
MFARQLSKVSRSGMGNLLSIMSHQVTDPEIRANSSITGLLKPHEHFSAWDDLTGYGGYVPSAGFFRAFYDNFVESHAHEIDQQMSMLSARILCIDHSHKVPKHLGKVGGEPVFGALHTTVNEYTEIRQMTFTPTKAHNQCMPPIANIPHSLRKYGHGDVEAIFTDSVTDKNELERVIPSLKHDVVPCPALSTFPELDIPSDWSYTTLQSAYQINTHLNIIMEGLDKLPESESLSLAMDMEWSVDRANGIFGRVAVVSIAFNKCIYLIQLSCFVHDDGYLHPPHALVVLLRSSRIKKVGVHIKADLTRLFKDCGFGKDDLPFVGAVELGAIAKQRSIAKHANVSLADLTAFVLRRYLPKDEGVRVSNTWDNAELSPRQQKYAALDVSATWTIFDTFSDNPVGLPVTPSTAAGTRVKIVSRDQTSTVAYGFISPDRPTHMNTVKVTKSHVIVNVTTIIQAGYLIHGDLLRSKQDTPLHKISSGGETFSLLCFTKDVQVTDNLPPGPNPSRSAPLPPLPYVSPTPAYLESPTDGQPPSHSDDAHADHHEMGMWPVSMPYDVEEEQSVKDSKRDSSSAATAQNVLEDPSLTYIDTEIRTRVYGDLWHLMDQFKIPLHHGLRRPFARQT